MSDERQSCCSDPLGPAPTGGRDRLRYHVRGLDCAEEVAALRRALSGHATADELSFDVLSAVMEVPASIAAGTVLRAVAGTGMKAQLLADDSAPPAPPNSDRLRRNALVLISGIGVLIGFFLHVQTSGLQAAIGKDESTTPALVIGFYSLAVLAGLILVLPKSWYSLRSLRPDMNLLMTLAVAGAIGIGQWFEAATVSFLFALSLALESWSVGRARKAVEKLLSLAPAVVRVRKGDGYEEVDPASVSVGTVFQVRPGERFALDGEVSQGVTEVNQAPITGESVPVLKNPGDEVFAGTINGNGSIEVQSTKAAADTTLAQIVRLVGEARKDRSPSERWVEKFARWYTPIVFASAAAVLLIPPLFFGGSWSEWIYRSLVLLVIGCPCALVIATPVAIVSGLAAAARHGVLIKGGRFLEAPASLKVVAFDKTGTITEGRPRVDDVMPHDDHTPEGLLAVAAAIERHNRHPLAQAIVERAERDGLQIPAASEVQILPGKGVTGTVNEKRYWLGSHRWLEERGQETAAVHEELERRSAAGRTVVVIGTDDHVCGFVTIADGIRKDAGCAIEELHAAGIERVAMLTGDNRGTAEAVAAEVGIDDVRAELLPADKVDVVESLEKEYGPVAMLGDGINDAPALARATLGVAMGAMGTDVAIETADIALMTDDLSRLAWLIRHSRRTKRMIQQNIAFALGIKLIFVILTFAGMASLWGAIAADMGASLLVVFNALRLLHGGRSGTTSNQ